MTVNEPGAYQKQTPPPPQTDAASQALPVAALIDVKNPANTFLHNVQGNILKGHGREHVRLLFLHFKSGAAAADLKAKLRAYFDRGNVQSAIEQRQFEERFNKFGIPGRLFSNVLLSATGYAKLGENVGQFNETPTLATFGGDGITFAAGARSPAVVELLKDTPVDTWEPAFRQEIDALIILADDDKAAAAAELNEAIQLFAAVADVVLVQVGDAIRNAEQDAIEHFGYIDGRSQPVFFQQDLQKEIAELDGEDPSIPGIAKNHVKFDPSAPKELVLVPDPFAPGDASFGSYFVFRKLEQNVRGFKQQEQALADKLNLVGDARELAGAYIVGRFEDGTPVVMQSEDGLRSPIPNNFNYDDDVTGQKCPFHSHLRKMNPRGDTVRSFGEAGKEAEALAAERGRRIARRGITYGERRPDADTLPIAALPTRDVGLLFMCFQANIPQQFGFMQRSWANNEDFAKTGAGVDPVIGHTRDLTKPIAQASPLRWGTPGCVRFDFSGFVTMIGGEFFFAPSLTYLKSL
jgi:Dyp-type peroxidase family